MDLHGKPVDLPLLSAELAAAGVDVPGLATSDDALYTFDAAGAWVDLPPEAVPVVDAHAAPPLFVEYVGARAVHAIVRTTDDASSEVFRFPTAPRHVYRATLRMTAIDAVSGATRDSEVRLVFKRPADTLAQVGATAVLSNAQDTAAASWRITPAVDGTDLVILVQGAAGRTVDWALGGEVGMFAPAGLEA